MPTGVPATPSYSSLIITPDMVPPNPIGWDELEQTYRAHAATWDAIHEQITADNARFRNAAQSPGFDMAHHAGQVCAEDALTVRDWANAAANMCGNIATVMRETRSAQDEIARAGNQAIAAAKTPGERETIIATYHAQARMQTGWGVAAAMNYHASLEASVDNARAQTLVQSMANRTGSAPAQPHKPRNPIQAVDYIEDEGGVADTTDSARQPRDTGATPGDGGQGSPAGSGSRGGTGDGAPTTQEGVPGVGDAAGNGGIGAQAPTAGRGGSSAAPSRPSPMSGMPGMLGGGMPGGMPSGGGGMPGGGGLPSAGSLLNGGPLSGLGGGLGDAPTAATGLSSGAGAGSPASAFASGLSAGSGLGSSAGPVPTPPPAAVPPATAAPGGLGGGVAPPGGTTPGLGTGAAGPIAPAAAPGGLGAAGPAAGGVPGGGGMLLPPGGMGAPAATPGAGPMTTLPAGGSSASGGSGVSAPVAPANAGATLVPASVVAAGHTATARDRLESRDVAAAKELAWQLQHAAETVRYPIEWAVGIFRSSAGTETVIVSNDGASYIPAGVHVPRSVRVIASDPLVDDDFRQLWFGWADPARVLVEYAGLRTGSGWTLSAAATTSHVSALVQAGVDHPPACTRQTSPLLNGDKPVTPPGLDGLHVHRLVQLWPDLYERLERVTAAAAVYQDRIVAGVSAGMVRLAGGQELDEPIPDPIRRIWMTRGGETDPPVQAWADYVVAAQEWNFLTSMLRPGFHGEHDPAQVAPEQYTRYKAYWRVARTAEHIGGWARRPLPLADMVYAAAAGFGEGVRADVETALKGVEEDLDELRHR